MSEVKFTKGPWGAAAKGSSIVGWPVVAPQAMGRMICNVSFAAHSNTNPPVPGDQAFNAESRANAHLIAAAPDMYSEIWLALQRGDLPAMVRERFETVLTKARGESNE